MVFLDLFRLSFYKHFLAPRCCFLFFFFAIFFLCASSFSLALFRGEVK